MKVTDLTIKGFLGKFDYDIKFNEDLTILTGPDEFGLSHLMKVIYQMISSDRGDPPLSFDKVTVHLNRHGWYCHVDNKSKGTHVRSKRVMTDVKVTYLDDVRLSFKRCYKIPNNDDTKFEDIVNKHFIFHKVTKNEDGDYVIIDTVTNEVVDMRTLPKSVWAIFQLLIDVYTSDSDIIIINHPETTMMHIVNQRRLINDLMELNSKAQFIIATQSPQLIGKYRDHQVDLMGLYYKDEEGV